MGKGLGRHPFNDIRNRSMGFVLQEEQPVVPYYKVWKHGIILDQGEEGACVGFSWQAWENSKPIGYALQQGADAAFAWYNRAKQLDPWQGEDYEGTSVLAGAKVAKERGGINSYLFANSFEELEVWLLSKGPVVVGSDWFNSMDKVSYDGFVQVRPESGARGGHAYLLLGKNKAGNYVFQNSWGEEYGKGGLFLMSEGNFYALVSSGNSEFCTALQKAPIKE
jgi:hypothetical protein